MSADIKLAELEGRVKAVEGIAAGRQAEQKHISSPFSSNLIVNMYLGLSNFLMQSSVSFGDVVGKGYA